MKLLIFAALLAAAQHANAFQVGSEARQNSLFGWILQIGFAGAVVVIICSFIGSLIMRLMNRGDINDGISAKNTFIGFTFFTAVFLFVKYS